MSDQKKNELLEEIEVIGFDLDNTLYSQSEEMQTRIRNKIYFILSSELKIDPSEAKSLFEQNYNGNFQWSHSGSRTINYIGEKFGIVLNGSNIVQKAIETADILDLIKPNPNLNLLLLKLSKKYKLDLITGSEKNYALKKLDKIAINPNLFEIKITGSDKVSKSDGSAYNLWISLRKINPKKIIYIGDNPKQDLLIPVGFGIKTCFIGEDSNADFCIKDIMELENIFN
jgi:FMN phosphatase YigB (HAD superfamily)